MAQDWYTPETETQGTTGVREMPPPLPPQPAIFHLRPLSLGEILDRTFSVYRSHFWLFAGIGCVAASLVSLMNAVQLIPLHLAKQAGTTDTANPFGLNSPLSPAYLAGLGFGFVLLLFLFIAVYTFVYVVTQAATVHAVEAVYLGRTTTISESIRATIGRWYRYLGIGIWQSFSMIWIPLLAVVVGGGIAVAGARVLGIVIAVLGGLAGLVFGFILYLRNSLGIQASVVESLTVRSAMGRSKVLTSGAKGRIFVLLLLAGVLNYVANLLQTPLLLFVTFTLARGGQAIGSEISMLLVSFVAHAAVQPVAMIGLSLLYFDQRVRQEALDLLVMLGPEVIAPPMPAAEPPAPFLAADADLPPAEPIAYAESPLDPSDPIGNDGRI